MSSMAGGELAGSSEPRSRALSSESERDNRLRYVGQPGGHVESHFLKANSPDGQRALWVKHTLLIPRAAGGPPLAELWAVAFDQGGRRKCALKRSFPLAALRRCDAPFELALPAGELGHGTARGALEGPPGKLAWSLRYDMPAQPFRPFPWARMYEGRFPRSKSLTPAPDTRLHGWFEAFGERWSIDGWRGAQGHNWGASHAQAYAWVHGNAWWHADDATRTPIEGCWLEALSGRVRLGRLVTPFLTVAALTIAGRTLRFDGLGALTARSITVDARSYTLRLSHGDVRLEAHFSGERESFAGLRYEDPDGSALSCLNAKLAHGELRLAQGKRTVHLRTECAALELGTRAADHGIELLA